MDKEDKVQVIIMALFVVCVVMDFIWAFRQPDPTIRHLGVMIVFYGVMNYVNTAWF